MSAFIVYYPNGQGTNGPPIEQSSNITTYPGFLVEPAISNFVIRTSMPAPIASGLRYQFDAAKNVPTTSGWTDANGYGNLTLYNSPTVTTGPVNYVTFNGTNQYGGSVDMTGLSAFTATLWVRTTSTADNGVYYLDPYFIGQDSAGFGSQDFGIVMGSGYAGVWSGLQSGSDPANLAQVSTSSPNYIAGGAWVELTVTSSYTNGTKLYINGTQFGSALTANQTTQAGQNWYIGASQRGYAGGGVGSWAATSISVVLLYTRELSSTEVTTNFTSYRNRFGV
jgi:hypothetical protein